MESLKRLASVRKTPGSSSTPPPPTVTAPAAETRPETSAPAPRKSEARQQPPRITVERADSILVDYSDPTAAMASAAADMVVSLVRRAKSTRETRRERRGPPVSFQGINTESKVQRSRSFDLPSHPAVRPIPQRRSTVKEMSTNQLAPSTSLKKRPSLLNRFRSLRGRPAPIQPTPFSEKPASKTPTDPHFVVRPKRGALDLTNIAGDLAVPRDSQDAKPRRSSIEKPPLEKEPQQPREQRPVVLVDAPYPSPPLSSPRQKGECSRCHSKRVQREHSVHKLTGEIPPRVTVNTSPTAEEKSSDPLNDYRLFTSSPASLRAEEANAYSNGGLLVPTSDGQRKGHTKAAPSWASYRDGDSDEEKVQAHRKSTLQPLIPVKAKEVEIAAGGKELAVPTVTIKRQRSIAQRFVDVFRPSRRGSVKPRGPQRVLTA